MGPTKFFKQSRYALLLGALLAALASFAPIAQAQLVAADPDWKESDAPPAPKFEIGRLISFDVNVNSIMRWGVDPASLAITPDGIVRYVAVAQSPSGVMNAMYEGIRCATGEYKTYARFNRDSGWSAVGSPNWKSMVEIQPSRHALALAKQGVCTGSAPASSPGDIVRSLKAR
jgi:CNP1-like family